MKNPQTAADVAIARADDALDAYNSGAVGPSTDLLCDAIRALRDATLCLSDELGKLKVCLHAEQALRIDYLKLGAAPTKEGT